MRVSFYLFPTKNGNDPFCPIFLFSDDHEHFGHKKMVRKYICLKFQTNKMLNVNPFPWGQNSYTQWIKWMCYMNNTWIHQKSSFSHKIQSPLSQGEANPQNELINKVSESQSAGIKLTSNVIDSIISVLVMAPFVVCYLSGTRSWGPI